MALAIRNQKEMESELHEQLYNNISLLTLEFSTTKEFNSNFKKDMFAKNNKAAFQHVIHFLLNIYDPVSFKQKVCWPILDIKMETQFRNEVMRFCNELATLNKESGIPLLMTSHVISPGGYRFVDFMHKLSQFVLLEHLKKDKNLIDEIILPMKPDSDNEIALQQLEFLNKLVENNYDYLTVKQSEFHQKFNSIKQDADTIMQQKQIIEKSHLDVKFQFREFLEKLEADLKNSKPVQPFEVMITQTEDQLRKLGVKENNFKHCAELVDILSLNRNVLRYEKHSFKSENIVGLVEFLETFYNNLVQQKHAAQLGKNVNFKNELETVNGAVEILKECYEKYELLNSELFDFVAQMEDAINNFNNNTLFCERFGDSTLVKKVQKIYDIVPYVNIRISNLI